jgi:hypothetical protein
MNSLKLQHPPFSSLTWTLKDLKEVLKNDEALRCSLQTRQELVTMVSVCLALNSWELGNEQPGPIVILCRAVGLQ